MSQNRIKGIEFLLKTKLFPDLSQLVYAIQIKVYILYIYPNSTNNILLTLIYNSIIICLLYKCHILYISSFLSSPRFI